MDDQNTSDYNKAIRTRLLRIMEIAGLERTGLAEFTKISDSHLYALLNGTRNITGEIADKIGAGFKLHGAQILNLNFEIPAQIRKSAALLEFYELYSGNPEFFIETKATMKDAYYIEHTLLYSSLFEKSVYVWQVKEACKEDKKNLTSKQISQKLNYLVQKKKLIATKRKLKKKNGEDGDREVLVYRRTDTDQIDPVEKK
jgi:plasmid maintenance system antidote protein VapI